MAKRSAKTILGNTYFELTDGVVWVWTAKARAGGWKIERYGDGATLNIAWIRDWAKENLTDPTVN